MSPKSGAAALMTVRRASLARPRTRRHGSAVQPEPCDGSHLCVRHHDRPRGAAGAIDRARNARRHAGSFARRRRRADRRGRVHQHRSEDDHPAE